MENFIDYRENRKVLNEQEDLDLTLDMDSEMEENPEPQHVEPHNNVTEEHPIDKGQGVSFETPIDPNTLPEEVVQRLTERIGSEYKAHYFYREATDFCKDAGYSKAAAYFEKESMDELAHAKMVRDYLIDWNVIPSIPKQETVFGFTGLVDIVNKAYVLEYDLFNAYMSDSRAIFPICLATFDFLKQLRDIQTNSVAEYSDLLSGAKLINPEDKLSILIYEKEYFEV
jgi:ferritin